MPSKMMNACYTCKHRGGVVGSVHVSCQHPRAALRHPEALDVRGEPQGIRGGWFVWPYDFDPVWLKSCDGYDPTAPEGGNK